MKQMLFAVVAAFRCYCCTKEESKGISTWSSWCFVHLLLLPSLQQHVGG